MNNNAENADKIKRGAWIGCLTQWFTSLFGIWLLASSDVLGYAGGAQVTERAIGPLIASFSVISAWEVTRKVRYLNVPLGLALAGLSLVFGPTAAIINDVLCGLIVAALAFVPYPITHSFGGEWISVIRPSRSTA